jgi:transposase
VKARRAVWHDDLADVPVGNLVFIDESSATTDMQRRRGRAPRGERCVAAGPAGHWKGATLIGAVRVDGPLACATLDGAVDTASFLAWVNHDLCPQLRRGDVVVMDNLSSHKSPDVAAAIEATGAQLAYLPPYSPDFNPIEPMWSKVKEALRSAAARTLDALGDAVARAMASVTADDCLGFFTTSGYATGNPKLL